MRFSYEDADNYGSTGSGGSFFKLENDGDKAYVQLLGHDMQDFPGYSVHEVYIGDKKKYVNCLREAGDPVDVCPLCANREKLLVKLFIPMFNIDDNEVQVWERGKKFFRDLSGYCSHIKDVSEVVTEIERRGKPKDTSTTYGLYEVRDEQVERHLDEFEEGEIPEIVGRYVLDKTADEIEYFLKHGDFPSDGNDDAEDTEVRRRGSNDKESRGSRTARRTSTRGRSNEEAF